MDRQTYDELARRMRLIPEVRADLVSIELSFENGHAVLEAIWSEVDRCKGHAGRAIRALLCDADELGIDVQLIPHWLAYDTDCHASAGEDDDVLDRMDALNELKLDNEQLGSWYSRLGFETTGEFEGDDPVMRRKAMARVHAPSP
jgi:hypothetical protein